MKNIFILLLCFLCSCSSKKNITVAYDSNWYPENFHSSEALINGLTEDLLMVLSKQSGKNITKMEGNWDSLWMNLQNENYNAILSTLEPRNFTEAKYDFSDIYLETGPVLVVPMDSSISSISSLEGKLVGMQRSNAISSVIEREGKCFLRFYPSDIELLIALEKGEIDAIVLNHIAALTFLSETFNGKAKILYPPVKQEGIRMVVLKGQNQDILDSFNSVIRKLKEKKEYKELLAKWDLSLE